MHVRLYESDGSTYGVGMPIIAYLSASITDGRPFAAATKVTVNGSPAEGAWYFEKSAIYPGTRWRPTTGWPTTGRRTPRSTSICRCRGSRPVPGLVYDNSLTLDMSTGAANISKIDGHTERMVVTSDGTQVFALPGLAGQGEHAHLQRRQGRHGEGQGRSAWSAPGNRTT